MLMYCELWTKWSKIEYKTGLLLTTLRYVTIVMQTIDFNHARHL